MPPQDIFPASFGHDFENNQNMENCAILMVYFLFHRVKWMAVTIAVHYWETGTWQKMEIKLSQPIRLLIPF
jgi:hypothetical protein